MARGKGYYKPTTLLGVTPLDILGTFPASFEATNFAQEVKPSPSVFVATKTCI